MAKGHVFRIRFVWYLTALVVVAVFVVWGACAGPGSTPPDPTAQPPALPADPEPAPPTDGVEDAPEPPTADDAVSREFAIDPGDLVEVAEHRAATRLIDAAAILHAGEHPAQRGVAEGALEAHRVALVHGRVLDSHGAAIEGAVVEVRGQPELGYAITRPDGRFDLAVNGGGALRLAYTATGRLPVERRVAVGWQRSTWAPDVVLIEVDQRATSMDLAAATTHVHEASAVEDGDGTRTTRVLVPAATSSATLTLPDGSTTTLEQITVRATEYTAGDLGPARMPAPLPANVAYTYAVEFTVDEAEALGATRVAFDHPVVTYVDNFLAFDAGERVPAASLDREQGRWVPATDGRVIAVIGLSDAGRALLDVTGEGEPADASTLAELGIDDLERERIAATFAVGASFWRVPVPHFSAWDYNWPFGLPEDAVAPDQDEPEADDGGPELACTVEGSRIGCQNQVLWSTVGLGEDDLELAFASARVPAYGRSIAVHLSGDSVPESLERIDLEITVAGRRHERSFEAAPAQAYTFRWDGRDVFGRELAGGALATVRLGYVYRGVYGRAAETAASFGRFPSELTAVRTREEITAWQSWEVVLTTWDARGVGLGGWTLADHHFFDPVTATVHFGDGTQRRQAALGTSIATIAGTGARGAAGDGGPATEAELWNPSAVAVAVDGSIYVADTTTQRVRKIAPDGTITTVAGTGDAGTAGDGGLAVDAELSNPAALAVAPDGTLYVVESGAHRVRRITPDGVITTVVGTGEAGFSGDGGPATAAQLRAPTGVAVAPDGTLYLSDGRNHRVRMVTPDGIISTVAGTGGAGTPTEGAFATDTPFNNPQGIALAPDGRLYVASHASHRVHRIGVDGVVSTAAGTGIAGFRGDGGPATEARLVGVTDVAVDADGALFVLERNNQRVRRVTSDGVITTVVGTGASGYGGDGGLATDATLSFALGLAFAPDGSLVIADTRNHRVRRVASPLGGLSGEILVPSADGSLVHVFAEDGRHLRTLHGLTGATLRAFEYDEAGRLSARVDAVGRVTSIERADDEARTVTLTAPSGRRATIALDERGYATAITTLTGDTFATVHDEDGSLVERRDPLGHTSRYAYDERGRLIRAEAPGGAVQHLLRTVQGDGVEVVHTSAAGRETTYLVERLAGAGTRSTTVFPDGTRSVRHERADGTTVLERRDGSVVRTRLGPDPRFGMLAPVFRNIEVETPSGLVSRHEEERHADLANPLDPLSIVTLTRTLTRDGASFETVYDAAERRLTETTPEGRSSVTWFDEVGRTVAEEIPGHHRVERAYDDAGRLIEVRTLSEDEDHVRTRTYEYDAYGRLVAQADPLGRRTAFAYDETGRSIDVVGPGGTRSHATYDELDRLTSLAPPGRPAHAFEYGPDGRVATYRQPDAGDEALVTYAYDGDGLHVETRADARTSIAEERDALGRTTRVALDRGDVLYRFDPATGHVSELVSPDGVALRYRYDGHLTTGLDWGGAAEGSVHLEYGPGQTLVGIGVGDGAPVTLEYDRDGHVSSAGPLVLTRSESNGAVTSAVVGRIEEAWTFDAFGHVVEHRVEHAGHELVAFVYERDEAGRVRVMRERRADHDEVSIAFEYDADGRLVAASTDGREAYRYAYDENGNRVDAHDDRGRVQATYDLADRLRDLGDTSFVYSSDGTLRSAGSPTAATEYTYDELGNLLGVALPDGSAIGYLVDGEQRRVARSVDGAILERYVYGETLLPVAMVGSDGEVSQFVFATSGHVPDVMLRDEAVFRFVVDHVGSVRYVIDVETGRIAQALRYDPFGRVLEDSEPGFQPFGFAGGLYDPRTGLVRLGARDYDADAGRWTAPDPLGFVGGDTNLFAYAFNDPVNEIDPTGLGRYAMCDRHEGVTRRLCLRIVEWGCSRSAAGCCYPDKVACLEGAVGRDGMCEATTERCVREYTDCMRTAGRATAPGPDRTRLDPTDGYRPTGRR